MNHSLPVADVLAFLQEDIGTGDVTAEIIPAGVQAQAEVITREDCVLCGQDWFAAVFQALDEKVELLWLVEEGRAVAANTVLCKVSGPARALLTGERTALNLLQTLSATATTARRYAAAVAGTGCKVLDTRKTVPGLRKAQKYAVACGGCFNHRVGLYDGVLIKENHIIASGSIALAVQAARNISTVPVEIEVENLAEFQQALDARPDRIMLDNFSLDDMRKAVALNAVGIELEASGNIDLNNIRTVAETGVDFISVGSLTKHINAVDLSMRIRLIKDDRQPS